MIWDSEELSSLPRWPLGSLGFWLSVFGGVGSPQALWVCIGVADCGRRVEEKVSDFGYTPLKEAAPFLLPVSFRKEPLAASS